MEFLTDHLFLILFGVLIVTILLVDLLLVGRHTHTVSLKESLIWTSIWVSLAIGFYFFMRYYGHLVHGITDWESLRAYTEVYLPKLELPDDFAGAIDQLLFGQEFLASAAVQTFIDAFVNCAGFLQLQHENIN